MTANSGQRMGALPQPQLGTTVIAFLPQLAKPAALAKLRGEIKNTLEVATKRLASQTKKAQKMWTKVGERERET